MMTSIIRFAATLLIASFASGAEIPPPISFEPSTSWDGNDGPWSSFTFQIGSPPQAIRLLPSTSTSAILAIIPQTCSTRIPGSCDKGRGSFLNISASSTWDTIGAFEIANYAGLFLGYGGGATYGFDNITLGWPGSGGAEMVDQVVGGSGSGDYYAGLFGLSPAPNNFTDVNNPKASLLGSLRQQNLVPSSSYGYTAGAYHRDRKPFASLTLGGYDSTMFIPNNTTFPFSTDVSRRLLVNLQFIATKNGAVNLLPEAIYAFIDSTDPNIWLPLDACKRFEEAFDLVWNEALEMYFFTISPNTTAKRAEADSIVFTIAENSTTSAKVSLEFPFAAFDLLASPPLTRNGTTQRYFPLKRGVNDTQYVLGRAFLQETYLVVDHERANFSVYQAAFPGPSLQQNVIPISGLAESSEKSGNSPPGVSKGAIAGMAVGGTGALSVVILATWLLIRKRSRQSHKQQKIEGPGDTAFAKPELDGVGKGPISESNIAHEAGGLESKPRVEVEVIEPIEPALELPGSKDQPRVISEMEGDGSVPEMDAQQVQRSPVYEMEGGCKKPTSEQ